MEFMNIEAASSFTGPGAVTLQDIADRCGVSKHSVARALRNERGRVSAPTRDRILAVARELGYDPSLQHAARRLALTKNGQTMINQVIALFFPPNFQQITYFSAMFQGVLDATMPRNYGVLTQQIEHQDAKKHYLLPPIFARGDVDAIIAFLPLGGFRHVLEQVRAMSSFGERPAVSLIEQVPGCSAVLTDDYAGGYAAMTHLLHAGHRRVLHSCYATYPHQQRLAGYRQACFDRTLDPDALLVSCLWNLYDDEDARLTFQQTLDAHPEITAILAPNDACAVKMADAVRERELSIPEDISLVGYDDTIPLLDGGQANILTSVRLPLVEVGREAAQLMIRRITGEADKDVTMVLPVSLIERTSVAAPRPR